MWLLAASWNEVLTMPIKAIVSHVLLTNESFQYILDLDATICCRFEYEN